jgi:hypothetical protein
LENPASLEEWFTQKCVFQECVLDEAVWSPVLLGVEFAFGFVEDWSGYFLIASFLETSVPAV